MAEAKDQTNQSNERISEGGCISWAELGKMIAAGNKEKNHYSALVNSAKEMMLIFGAYKEAGFNDEQALAIVLKILETALSNR